VLGSGFGYVLGGVLGRRAGQTAEVARTTLRDVDADTLVAGAVGLVGGVLLGAGVAWPVFLLPQAYLAFPLFGIVAAAGSGPVERGERGGGAQLARTSSSRISALSSLVPSASASSETRI
ncbi:MAG TPA: hypothetical protein VNU26_00055, partial [Mycobacteriales bacterium]|nr:hypothetical protein [Mycobacteriales bacterium]